MIVRLHVQGKKWKYFLHYYVLNRNYFESVWDNYKYLKIFKISFNRLCSSYKSFTRPQKSKTLKKSGGLQQCSLCDIHMFLSKFSNITNKMDYHIFDGKWNKCSMILKNFSYQEFGLFYYLFL